jgi:hypothetical protein
MQHDVPAGVPQEVDGWVQLGAVRGGGLQLGAVDLLRAGEDQLQAAADHQRLRLRRGGRLRRLLPGVRAQEGQGADRGLLPAAGRGGVRAHRLRHAEARRPGPPRQVPRQRLPGLLHGRLRGAAQHHREGGEDQERGVPAHQPVLLPHPQRRRMVLLRPLHQGPVRHGNHNISIEIHSIPQLINSSAHYDMQNSVVDYICSDGQRRPMLALLGHILFFIQYPNVGGFFFSCIQMGLYFWYRRPRNTNAAVLPTTTDGAVQGQQAIELPAGHTVVIRSVTPISILGVHKVDAADQQLPADATENRKQVAADADGVIINQPEVIEIVAAV